ncbi:hypothetical protein QBC34DRAFT_379248 [Podospora aff. communis PSN243]|uniref:Ankyrin repeat protein n=1 Tax=Podospora aff. communis PSN243 TaxID=3040156 RepID=A0AAV9GQ52_9PEZI|nr:hypothetical protein QBC34DRAFT_379248 [Podospora aff. communis PSN243]
MEPGLEELFGAFNLAESRGEDPASWSDQSQTPTSTDVHETPVDIPASTISLAEEYLAKLERARFDSEAEQARLSDSDPERPRLEERITELQFIHDDISHWFHLAKDKKIYSHDLARIFHQKLGSELDKFLAQGTGRVHQEAQARQPRRPRPCRCMVPALGGHNRIVEILLNAGADPSARTFDGDSALDAAVKGGHTNVADLVMDALTNGPDAYAV